MNKIIRWAISYITSTPDPDQSSHKILPGIAVIGLKYYTARITGAARLYTLLLILYKYSQMCWIFYTWLIYQEKTIEYLIEYSMWELLKDHVRTYFYNVESVIKGKYIIKWENIYKFLVFQLDFFVIIYRLNNCISILCNLHQ